MVLFQVTPVPCPNYYQHWMNQILTIFSQVQPKVSLLLSFRSLNRRISYVVPSAHPRKIDDEGLSYLEAYAG